jgi:hypothetical protein
LSANTPGGVSRQSGHALAIVEVFGMSVDPEAWDALRLLATAEVDYARGCVADADELLALTEQGRAIGGHWGDDSERYLELCLAVDAHQHFPPRNWWRDGGLLDRED